MLLTFKVGFAIITVVLALYGLFTGNSQLMPWMFISMALMFLTKTIDEYMKDHTISAIICLITSTIILYVSFSTLLN